MTNGFDNEQNRLKQALEELTALNQIANAINALMSVDKITQVIVDHCVRRVRASQGAVFLLDDKIEKTDGFKTFIREFSISSEKIPVHLHDSLMGWMIKNKSILVSNNPDADDRFGGFRFSSLGVYSILTAPLTAREGLIGTLAVFNKKDAEGFTENDKRFLGIVASQAAKVLENARLHEKEEKLAIMQEEMKLARNIQQGFLPRGGVSSPGWEIYGFNFPASEVGGDFYDIVKLDQERIFVSLGDVSGKGMPAALLMSNAQAVLRAQLVKGGEIHLEDLADSLNNLICQFSGPEQFITAIIGLIDCKKMNFSFINAGHLSPILIKGNGKALRQEGSDLIIGILPTGEFDVRECRLESGDLLFLFSDGISELYGADERQFGEERLTEFLVNNRGLQAQSICSELFEELNRFRGDRLQSDDITMLAIKALIS
jgi:sigma-B regulation protein RsbU (phosphoserine phosphatase)